MPSFFNHTGKGLVDLYTSVELGGKSVTSASEVTSDTGGDPVSDTGVVFIVKLLTCD